MCRYIDILRSDDVGLQGKPLALNSAFRSSMRDSYLDMVAACRQFRQMGCADLRQAKKAVVPPHFERGARGYGS